MIERLIDLYANNPTEGATDGSMLSANGESTAPLKVQLDASLSESKTVKLAIRTDSGYKTKAPTTITAAGDVYDRWQFSLTEDGDFADAITIDGTIGDSNTIFYARATSSSLEHAHNDTDVSFHVAYVITSVDDTFSDDTTTAVDDTTSVDDTTTDDTTAVDDTTSVDDTTIDDTTVDEPQEGRRLTQIWNNDYPDATLELSEYFEGDERIRALIFRWDGNERVLVINKWLGDQKIYSCTEDCKSLFGGSPYTKPAAGEIDAINWYVFTQLYEKGAGFSVGDWDWVAQVYDADDFLLFEETNCYLNYDEEIYNVVQIRSARIKTAEEEAYWATH